MAERPKSDFYPTPVIDRGGSPSAVTRLLIFVAVLIGAAVLFSLFRDELGEPFLVGLLGVLAMIGVGYLFATAVGFIRVAPQSSGDEIGRAHV